MSNQPATDYRIRHLREKLGELYDFEALLGRGAFAAVYLVRNLRLDRFEALKVLSDAYDRDETFVKRFVQEAKLVASLDHPNIVKVYDFGEIDGIVWFSMQYVDGPTLRAELSAQGRLPPVAVARLTIPLLEALGYSHQQGTVHRDVKPSNILLDRRGHPYIMDFGIAKSSANVMKTMTGRILGTPAFISPEQIQGEVVDGRADLYSLATTMYEMLAGRTPFPADDSLRTIVKRVYDDPDPLSMHCVSLDETLESIVMRGLARHPENRYPNAAAMSRALVEYLNEQSDRQEMVPIASAPEPQAIEDLPSTVPELSPVRAAQETPTVEIRSDTGAESPTPVSQRALVWTALAGVLALGLGAVAIFGPRLWRHDQSPSLAGSAAANSAPVETAERPVDEDREAAHDGLEPQPARAERRASREGEPSGEGSGEPSESAGSPPPETRSPEPAALPPPATPRAPSPPPFRRPVTVPRILTAVEPVLDAARATECGGQSVIISLRVGENGKVSRSKILEPGSPECTEAARSAAEAYVFEPARDARGQPVPASTTVNVRFNEAQP